MDVSRILGIASPSAPTLPRHHVPLDRRDAGASARWTYKPAPRSLARPYEPSLHRPEGPLTPGTVSPDRHGSGASLVRRAGGAWGKSKRSIQVEYLPTQPIEQVSKWTRVFTRYFWGVSDRGGTLVEHFFEPKLFHPENIYRYRKSTTYERVEQMERWNSTSEKIKNFFNRQFVALHLFRYAVRKALSYIYISGTKRPLFGCCTSVPWCSTFLE